MALLGPWQHLGKICLWFKAGMVCHLGTLTVQDVCISLLKTWSAHKPPCHFLLLATLQLSQPRAPHISSAFSAKNAKLLPHCVGLSYVSTRKKTCSKPHYLTHFHKCDVQVSLNASYRKMSIQHFSYSWLILRCLDKTAYSETSLPGCTLKGTLPSRLC